MTVKKAIQKIEELKRELHLGLISYDEAKLLAVPPMRTLNDKAEVIAKKFGKKHSAFTFSGLIR